MASDDSVLDECGDTYDRFCFNLEKVQEALLDFKGRPWKSFFDMSPLEKYWAINYGESEDIEKMRLFGFDNIIRLDKNDMAVFGIFPEIDPFYAVVCDICHDVIKPNRIRNHLLLRHENQRNGSRSHYPYKLNDSSTARSLNNLPFRPSSSRANQQYDEIYTPIIQHSTKVPIETQPRKTTATKTVKNIRQTVFGPKGSSIRLVKKTLDGPSSTSSSSSNSPSSVVINKSRSNSPDAYLFAKSSDSAAPQIYGPAIAPKMIPMKNRQYDPDKHCGCIIYFNGKQQPPCVRSLTCSTHSVITKRAVQGRSKEFDILLTDYQRGDSSNSSSSIEQNVEINIKEEKVIDEQIAKKHSESIIPENFQPITYDDVLKMIIPSHTITSDGRNPVEIFSHSYRTVESNPYDPNDPYAQYRLTLPRSERFKSRIKVLVRTIDTIIDSDEEYDLKNTKRNFHDFRDISVMTETSYRIDNDSIDEKQLIKQEELQLAIQEAVRTKYEKNIISETLTIEFAERMSYYMANEQNSKIIRKILKTNDMRKVKIEKSLEGMLDLTNGDVEIRDSLEVPLAPDAIFDFHIPDEFLTDQLQEVEIFPEDLAQDETLAELFNNTAPNEPITLENLLAVLREEGIVKKSHQQGVKRSLNDKTGSVDKNETKKMKLEAIEAPETDAEKIINCKNGTAVVPMIIDEQIDENFMTVDPADMNEIINNNLMDDGIEIPGVERNASPINFLFDMNYQNQSLSDSECDDEENSGCPDLTETDDESDDDSDGTDDEENLNDEEEPIKKLIEPIQPIQSIEPIQPIEPIQSNDYELIPSSLIDGLSTINSNDIAPITMELPDMLFQESPVKSPEPIELEQTEIISNVLPDVVEPETIVVPKPSKIPDLMPIRIQAAVVELEPIIEEIPFEPEIIEIVDDDEDILEIVYLGSRSESQFKRREQFFGNFPEFESKVPEVDTSEMELPVINPLSRARMFPGVRKWHTELPGPIMIPSKLHKPCGGGLTANKKKLPLRKSFLTENEKSTNNVFEMTTKKNGECSTTTTRTNLFLKSMQMNKTDVTSTELEETEEENIFRCSHAPDMKFLDKLIK